MTPQEQFEDIHKELTTQNEKVTSGKMMSSSAICYKGKVFAFFHDGQMTFKLGDNFEPEAMGITEYRLLSPFKTKPPMRAWFTISFSEQTHWKSLAIEALTYIQSSSSK